MTTRVIGAAAASQVPGPVLAKRTLQLMASQCLPGDRDWKEPLQNYPYRVEWGIKPSLNKSINKSMD